MFEHLKNKRILVTGPQRSGTTICARMIAHDAGLEYVDEFDIGVQDINRARNLFEHKNGFVLQAPGLAHLCHKINADCVVFMIRPVPDIIKSQERIGWAYEPWELEKYKADKGPVAAVKYKYWYEYQRDFVNGPIEVKYADLEQHPLFEKDRKRFSARQWKKEN